MEIKSRRTLISVFFILGVFLLLVGAGTAFVERTYNPFSLLGIFTGIFFLAGSFFILYLGGSHLLNPQQLFKCLFTVSIVSVFLVFVVMINHWAYRNDVEVDMTRFKQHTLSEQTRELLTELDRNIVITVFYAGLPPKYLEDLLKAYEEASDGKIRTEIVDPLIDIGYAAQFGSVITGKERRVIIQSGEMRQDLSFSEEPLDEELLNNGIIRVTRPERTVCFLTGHGEYNIYERGDFGLSDFAALLKKNNILSQRILLNSTQEVPDLCEALVIAGPKKEISGNERELIQEYLKGGGDALFLVEHVKLTTPDKPLPEEEKKLNPSLNTILKEWGVRVADDVVVDIGSHASGDVGSPATNNYMPHTALIRGLDYTFYVRPRSISGLPDMRGTLKTVPFVLTSSNETSWGEKDRTLNIKYDPGIDRPGPVPISYVIFEPKAEGESSDTRIIVFTDADFINNTYLDYYSNAQMGLNVIAWLTETDYKTYNLKDKVEVNRLDLTSKQKRQVLMVLVMVPVFVATAGMMIWLRRRIS